MVWVGYGLTHLNEEAMNDDSSGPDGHADRHHLVLAPNLVKIRGQGPGGRIGVVRLYICSAPGGVAIAINKKRFIPDYDRDHNSIADESTQHGAIYLGQEHDPRGDLNYINASTLSWDQVAKGERRNLTIFTQLQVTAKVD